MIILECFQNNYDHDPIRNLNLHKYKDKLSDDYVLIIGLGFNFKNLIFPRNLHNYKPVKKYIKQGKKLMYIDFEEGNPFYPVYFQEKEELSSFEKKCHKIYTICPYTAKYLNNKYNNKKRVNIPFFFSEDFIKEKFNKDIDVIYTGGFSERTKELNKFLPLYDIFNVIKEFNYCWLGGSIGNYNDKTYQGKLNLYSKSKIAVVHNALVTTADQLSFDFKNLEHFKYVESHSLVPQIKSRVFEAGFNKCIILAYKDPYNTIELFFEKDKDFIYWSNKEELNNLIKNILKNYEDYKYLAENAYKKSIDNYTTKKFFENFITKHL